MEDILRPFHIEVLRVNTNRLIYHGLLFLASQEQDKQPNHRMIWLLWNHQELLLLIDQNQSREHDHPRQEQHYQA